MYFATSHNLTFELSGKVLSWNVSPKLKEYVFFSKIVQSLLFFSFVINYLLKLFQMIKSLFLLIFQSLVWRNWKFVGKAHVSSTMLFAQRLLFFLLTASVLLLSASWITYAAPTDNYDMLDKLDVAQNDPGFRSNICQFLCTKDPPEGGNFCNCDRHPLGWRSGIKVRRIYGYFLNL